MIRRVVAKAGEWNYLYGWRAVQHKEGVEVANVCYVYMGYYVELMLLPLLLLGTRSEYPFWANFRYVDELPTHSVGATVVVVVVVIGARI